MAPLTNDGLPQCHTHSDVEEISFSDQLTPQQWIWHFEDLMHFKGCVVEKDKFLWLYEYMRCRHCSIPDAIIERQCYPRFRLVFIEQNNVLIHGEENPSPTMNLGMTSVSSTVERETPSTGTSTSNKLWRVEWSAPTTSAVMLTVDTSTDSIMSTGHTSSPQSPRQRRTRADISWGFLDHFERYDPTFPMSQTCKTSIISWTICYQ